MKKDKRFENAMLILDELSKSKIESSALWIGILCVVAKESGLIPKREKSFCSTSVLRLRSLFSRLRSMSDDEIDTLKKDNIRFFDKIYGGKLGNRPGTSDGWVFRGGGHNQITGRRWFSRFGIADCPEQVTDPRKAAEIVVSFFEGHIENHEDKIVSRYDAHPNEIMDTDTAIMVAANINAGLGHGRKSATLQRAFKNSLKFKPEMIGFYNEWWGAENMEVE